MGTDSWVTEKEPNAKENSPLTRYRGSSPGGRASCERQTPTEQKEMSLAEKSQFSLIILRKIAPQETNNKPQQIFMVCWGLFYSIQQIETAD